MKKGMRERVSGDDVCDCCFDVPFLLDQHALLNLLRTGALKQRSVGRHVAPLRYSILIPSQPAFALTHKRCLHLRFFYFFLVYLRM